MQEVYYVEVSPRYVSLVRPIFRRIADGEMSGVTELRVILLDDTTL